MPKLARDVHVTYKDKQYVFTPADDLPNWAVAAITNPAAWADGNPHDPNNASQDANQRPRQAQQGS